MTVDTDVAIIGGGLAGLTAAMFSSRYGLRTILLDPMAAGGQIVNEERIEDYPGLAPSISGYELGPTAAEQAQAAGAEIILTCASSLDLGEDHHMVRHDSGAISATSLIIACGSTLSRLGIPGELVFEGRGVSHCASCDGPLCEGQTVCVVGGGDSALRSATIVSRHAREVLVFVRGSEFVGQHALVQEVLNAPNVRVVWNHDVVEVCGDTVVTSVLVRDAPSGMTSAYAVANVFINVGLEPNSGWLSGTLEIDDGGHIVTDIEMRTRVPGVFAAGDIRQHSARQLVTAAGDGATAAIAAYTYVRSKTRV